MRVRAKKLRFSVDLAASGELTEETGIVLDPPPEWKPEHLALAALIRCSLTSLRYHAKRSSFDVTSASGNARTLVTKEGGDARYAMVKTEVDLRVEIEPEPGQAAMSDLLELAERDCFVGASLAHEPRYRWIVNGRTIGA